LNIYIADEIRFANKYVAGINIFKVIDILSLSIDVVLLFVASI